MASSAMPRIRRVVHGSPAPPAASLRTAEGHGHVLVDNHPGVLALLENQRPAPVQVRARALLVDDIGAEREGHPGPSTAAVGAEIVVHGELQAAVGLEEDLLHAGSI